MVGNQGGGGSSANLGARGKADKSSVSGANSNIVKFFDAYGKFVRSLKIPVETIKEVFMGRRRSASFFSRRCIHLLREYNIRHRYLWTYF